MFHSVRFSSDRASAQEHVPRASSRRLEKRLTVFDFGVHATVRLLGDGAQFDGILLEGVFVTHCQSSFEGPRLGPGAMLRLLTSIREFINVNILRGSSGASGAVRGQP